MILLVLLAVCTSANEDVETLVDGKWIVVPAVPKSASGIKTPKMMSLTFEAGLRCPPGITYDERCGKCTDCPECRRFNPQTCNCDSIFRCRVAPKNQNSEIEVSSEDLSNVPTTLVPTTMVITEEILSTRTLARTNNLPKAPAILISETMDTSSVMTTIDTTTEAPSAPTTMVDNSDMPNKMTTITTEASLPSDPVTLVDTSEMPTTSTTTIEVNTNAPTIISLKASDAVSPRMVPTTFVPSTSIPTTIVITEEIPTTRTTTRTTTLPKAPTTKSTTTTKTTTTKEVPTVTTDMSTKPTTTFQANTKAPATITSNTSGADPWLQSGKCGPRYPLPDGHSAQCNPKGKYPCCNPESGWCGSTPKHCACKGCTDYRDPWLPGGKCGPQHLLPSGRPGQCNPQGKHPCCNPHFGWCGSTKGHCACSGCIDYNGYLTPLAVPSQDHGDSSSNAPDADPWLYGGRCGPKHLLPDGRPGQCNPQGKHPCCNGKSGWCGNSKGHCACKDCIDYRNLN